MEGAPIGSLPTMADAVGERVCASLDPPPSRSARISCHGSRTPPRRRHHRTRAGLGGKCDVARCWVYVKDDSPLRRLRSASGNAFLLLCAIEAGEHPQAHLANYSGILQADAFGGYTKLYDLQRSPGPIRNRPVGSMPGARSSPWRILRKTRDVRLLARRRSPSRRLRSRSCAASTPSSPSNARSMAKAPTTERLSARRRARRWLPIWKPICVSSAPSSPAVTIWQKAMNYMFKRWDSFTRFLDDGRVCLSNNAPPKERAARHRIGQKVVVILRVRPRRASRAAAMYSPSSSQQR